MEFQWCLAKPGLTSLVIQAPGVPPVWCPQLYNAALQADIMIPVEVDCFKVSLHRPNGRQLPFGLWKGTVSGPWKTVWVPTSHGHLIPQCIINCQNSVQVRSPPIFIWISQMTMSYTYPTDTPIDTKLGTVYQSPLLPAEVSDWCLAEEITWLPGGIIAGLTEARHWVYTHMLGANLAPVPAHHTTYTTQFTEEINQSSGQLPLNFNGNLLKLGLIASLV